MFLRETQVGRTMVLRWSRRAEGGTKGSQKGPKLKPNGAQTGKYAAYKSVKIHRVL